MQSTLGLNGVRLAAFVLICSLLACSKEINPVIQQEETGVSVKNGRLSFKNTSEVIKTLNQLRGFKTQELIADWESNRGFSSLRKYNSEHSSEQHLADMDLPVVYKAILNSEGEYAVGDTIVWFDKNYNYFIPRGDEMLLASVKKNPTSYKDRYEIMLKPAISKLKENVDHIKVNTTNLGTASGPDARYQHEWAVNGQTGPWRKSIFEMQAYSFPHYQGNGITYYDQGLNIRVKLEWWSPGHGWQAGAGETQDPMVNISGFVTPLYGNQIGNSTTGSASFNVYGPHTTYNHDTDLTFYSEYLPTRATSFTISVGGTLTSTVTWNGVFQTESPFYISNTPNGLSDLW
ncbi:hypothetical protein [Spirosoma endophyticum]|nr:hypothetical protein [Spirosoma endophyticum]